MTQVDDSDDSFWQMSNEHDPPSNQEYWKEYFIQFSTTDETTKRAVISQSVGPDTDPTLPIELVELEWTALPPSPCLATA